MTTQEMKKAKEILEKCFDEKSGKAFDNGIVTFYEFMCSKDVAIQALDALLNAEDCFPPLKQCHNCGTTDFNNHAFSCKRGSYLSLMKGYNLARSEDIAVLAKKMMGLERVIALKLSQLLVKDESDKLGYTKAKVISDAIKIFF